MIFGKCIPEKRKNPELEDIAIAKLLKANDRAFADRELLVIGSNGEQLGRMRLGPACTAAQEAKLDLVLVAETSEPPVCRIMDFGKLCYEQKKKLKDQKKKNLATQKVKEIKFRLHIDTHDYECKLKHGIEFLGEGSKLKVTIQFKGREMAHTEMGFELFGRITGDLKEYGTPDGTPKLLGKSICMSFSPKGSH